MTYHDTTQAVCNIAYDLEYRDWETIVTGKRGAYRDWETDRKSVV